jgi:hypothetical protein
MSGRVIREVKAAEPVRAYVQAIKRRHGHLKGRTRSLRQPESQCSFCGYYLHEGHYRYLLMGLQRKICDECLGKCNDILAGS